MIESQPDLRDLFNEPDLRLKDKSSAEGREWAERLRRELPGAEWVASKYDVVSKLSEVLDVKVPDILVSLWKTSDEIEAAVQKSKELPTETIDLELWEHTLEGTFKPQLEVQVAKLPPVKIEFILELEFAMEDVKLKIKNGAILPILSGTGVIKGTLKHGDLVLATAPREGQGRITLTVASATNS